MLLQIAQNGRPTFVLFWYFLSQPFWCSFEKHLNTGYNFRRSFGIKTFPQSRHFGTKVKLPGIELRHFTFALWFCCCIKVMKIFLAALVALYRYTGFLVYGSRYKYILDIRTDLMTESMTDRASKLSSVLAQSMIPTWELHPHHRVGTTI